jgi:hypothetical protein
MISEITVVMAQMPSELITAWMKLAAPTPSFGEVNRRT